jgi:hypothetical protein
MTDVLPPATPLYRALLGDAWNELPAPIRDMHDFTDVRIASGFAIVERGTGLLSRIAAAIFGFPQAGEGIPVSVIFRREGEREIWERNFGGRTFRSVIEPGRGSWAGLQCERFGALAFAIALSVDNGRLLLTPRHWTAFGIPMPRFLLPQGDSCEHAGDGRFNFNVELRHPLTGPIVRYRGWLVPQNPA